MSVCELFVSVPEQFIGQLPAQHTGRYIILANFAVVAIQSLSKLAFVRDMLICLLLPLLIC